MKSTERQEHTTIVCGRHGSRSALSMLYLLLGQCSPQTESPPISKSLEYLKLFEHRRKLENYSQEIVQIIL